MSHHDYPDTNGNGIPDAFESRPPIIEILNTEPSPAELYGTVIVEIEKRPRQPKKGELFFCGSSRIEKAAFDHSRYSDGTSDGFMIIKRIIAGTLDGYGGEGK